MTEEKKALPAHDLATSLSLFATWWAMVEAHRELSEEPRIDDDAVVLHFMGSGASCQVYAKDIRNIITSAPWPKQSPEYLAMKDDAARLRWLIEQAGYLGDGSQTPVVLDQDDATMCAFVRVGDIFPHRSGPQAKYYGNESRSLRAAIDDGMKKTAAK